MADNDDDVVFTNSFLRKVRFNLKPNIYFEKKSWELDYWKAREDEWLRDIFHFRRRIELAELALSPILKYEHRRKIYNQRFFNNRKF